jgi:hypothetical protein
MQTLHRKRVRLYRVVQDCRADLRRCGAVLRWDQWRKPKLHCQPASIQQLYLTGEKNKFGQCFRNKRVTRAGSSVGGSSDVLLECMNVDASVSDAPPALSQVMSDVGA